MKRILVIAGLAALAACKTADLPPPQPIIETVTVNVPTPVPCKGLSALGPAPAYPDTDAAIAEAAKIADPGARVAALAKLYRAGRLMRIQREAEYIAAAAACNF